ncbi:S16 family serine protease [Paenibacillus sp. IITD108]
MYNKLSYWHKALLSALATAVMMWLLLYSPTPYVIFEPGIAVPVKPMVDIEQINGEESKGKLLLTAVKLSEPNFFEIIKSAFDRDKEVFYKYKVFQGQSKKQYAEQLAHVMQGSQNAAIEAAYHFAGIPYSYKLKAISVAAVKSREEGGELLHAGDIILGLKGKEQPDSLKDMVQQLKPERSGQTFELEIIRGTEPKDLLVTLDLNVDSEQWSLEQLADQLGVQTFAEARELVPAQSDAAIDIKAGEIGGPSAGLVFALHAIDLLTEGDLTEGLVIAATGTINSTGQVGAIGGIKQKVVITSKQGVQLFLVPKANEKEAVAKAKSLHTAMQVVGVSTLQDAIAAIHQVKGR